MSQPPDRSIRCPVLIGRTPQLAALERIAATVREGHGQVALIAGEAGIGKSRLVAEVGARLTGQGFGLLLGRCFEHDHMIPYAPLLALLRSHLDVWRSEAVDEALGPLAAHLTALLPELTPFRHDAPPMPVDTPAQAHHRTAQAFVQFFTHWSARAPLLVLIEDLHWSDDLSLEVLLRFARSLATKPILLLLTYRDDEASPSLTRALAGLEREHLAEELRLPELGYAEVDAMVRAIFNQRQPIRGDFLTMLVSLTEGNPFFVEEMLKSLVTTGDIYYAHGQWDRKPLDALKVPRTVQVAVRQRADALSPDVQQLLKVAAVIGRRFDFGLLQRVTGHDERALLERIKSLVAVQLVVEETAEIFAFRHALTRETLRGDLLARERKVLHGQIALALEEVGQGKSYQASDVIIADLSYHYYAAEQWLKALEYAQEGAERAVRLHAPRPAIEHLARAIEATRRLTRPVPSSLHRARGQMYELLGEFEQARDDYESALGCAELAGDLRACWQALLALGFLWAARDNVLMGDYLRRALELARKIGDPLLIAQSVNRLGNWYLRDEQPQEALRYHHEALALFDMSGDQRGLAATHDLLGLTHVISGDIPTGMTHYTQAVGLFRTLGDLQGLSSSLATVSMRGASYPWTTTVWPPSDAASCARDGEAALQIARQIDWRAGEAGALVYLAFGHGPRGDYARALERAELGFTIAREIEHGVWLVGAQIARGAIALDLLAFAQARKHLEAALGQARQLGSFFVQNIAGLLVSACIAQRDFVRAAEVLSTTFEPEMPMETQGQRASWCARAEFAFASNEFSLALQIVDQLIERAPHAAQYGSGSIPRLWLLRGEVLAALGATADAEAALLAADEATRRLDLPPMRWRIQCSLGRLYQRVGHRKRAETAFAAARAIVDELAACVPDRELRETFVQAAATLIPSAPAPTPRRVLKKSFDGLTEREREIAVLVAQGRSNREIAEALVLSEHTVARHVSHILAKLSVASRAQVAVWASEKGLTKQR